MKHEEERREQRGIKHEEERREQRSMKHEEERREQRVMKHEEERHEQKFKRKEEPKFLTVTGSTVDLLKFSDRNGSNSKKRFYQKSSIKIDDQLINFFFYVTRVGILEI